MEHYNVVGQNLEPTILTTHILWGPIDYISRRLPITRVENFDKFWINVFCSINP